MSPHDTPSPTAAAPARRLRPGLLVALLAVAGLTLWSLSLPGDEGDDGPAARPTAATRPADALSARPASSGAASRQAGATDGWANGPVKRTSIGSSIGSSSGLKGNARGERPSAAAVAELQAGVRRDTARWSARADWPSLGDAARAAWGPPPPPPPPPAAARADEPPPPPVAPPFPYQLVGRWEEPGAALAGADAPAARERPPAPAPAGAAPRPSAATTIKAVIAGPQATWVLAAGEVIDGQWRIDRVGPRGLELTYLPLQLPQTVAMKTP